MSDKLPKTICPLPWVNLSLDVNGSSRPCCKFTQYSEDSKYQLANLKDAGLQQTWNSEAMVQLRKDFLSGQKPKECAACWSEEAAGIKSYRQSFLGDRTSRAVDYQNIEPDAPITLDLKLSNVCNLKCRICGPVASSLWLKEEINRKKKIPTQFDQYIKENRQYFTSEKITNTESNKRTFKSWLPNIEHIEMTGGEPLLSPENQEVLDMIMRADLSSQISLLYNTNATIFKKSLTETWRQFKKVKICLSVDDIRERFEYQRSPAKWESVKKNIDNYYQASDNRQFIVYAFNSISNYNIWYLPEYIEFFQSHYPSMEIYLNYVHYDKHFCVQVMPRIIKEKVKQKLSSDILEGDYNPNVKQSVRDLIDFMFEHDEPNLHLWEKFKNVTAFRDKVREESYKEIFPEFYSIIKETKLDQSPSIIDRIRLLVNRF